MHTSAGILILMLASVPIAVVWLNSESILLLLRQVPCVARSAALLLLVLLRLFEMRHYLERTHNGIVCTPIWHVCGMFVQYVGV